MTDETQPTSEWEYSHALNSGDVVVDRQGSHSVEVHDDGSVTWDGETFDEQEVAAALRDGVIERSDGKSHELASY